MNDWTARLLNKWTLCCGNQHIIQLFEAALVGNVESLLIGSSRSDAFSI